MGDGGGFLNTNNAALTISSTTFNNNRSNGDGGGLFLATGVASSLTNVTISNNVAQGNGGGLFDEGNNGGVITLQNDTIAFNTAQSAGGVFDGDATMRLINTIIAQNLSEKHSCRGASRCWRGRCRTSSLASAVLSSASHPSPSARWRSFSRQ